jgi:hypothetical protein
MLLTNVFEIGIPIFFFLINIVWTQRIYNGRYLLLWICLSFLLPVVLFFIIPQTSNVQILNLSLLLFYYFILLLTIKKTYKKINNYFIGKNLLANEFSGKDFTYFQWNGSNPTSPGWWDEKRAKKPSWLDDVLTLLLLTLPFLASVLVYTATKNVSLQ